MTHPADALRLVPIEPTSAMTQEGLATYYSDGRDDMETIRLIYAAMLAAAPASPLPEGGGTSYAAGGLDVLSRIRSRLNEQIERAEADLNSTVTIRLNDAKAIRHLLVPAAPTGDA